MSDLKEQPTRVFVVGTGRCGTSTFFQACRHATNYIARHESFIRLENPARLFIPPYPSIEIGSQLTVFIPKLRRQFPDARWVHLLRDREPCVKSLSEQCSVSMWSFAQQWLLNHNPDTLLVAGVFYDAVNDMCRAMLPEHAFVLKMEEAYDRWDECWRYMRCRGNFDESREEWRKAYNPAENRGLNHHRQQEIPDVHPAA